VRVELFSGSADEWDAFVAGQARATASHLHGWRRIIGDVYGHDCPYLATRDERGALTGVLPLVDVRSLFFGRALVSMPFLNAGGPIGGPDAIEALAAAAADLAARRRTRFMELRSGDALQIGLAAVTEKVACVLPLQATPEAVWAAFPGKLRSQIRRAQKENMTVRFGPEQRSAFFSVFARNMRDLGSPTHRARFFEAIAEELSDRVWFGVVYYDDRPVAAGCALQFGEEVEMTWASSLREYSAAAPNMLLYWSFIERAATLHLRRFNFGRSTPDTGTHRFKRQWGALDTMLHWYRSPSGALPSTSGQHGGLSLATRIWQHLPVPLATGVGSRLRGGIPA